MRLKRLALVQRAGRLGQLERHPISMKQIVRSIWLILQHLL
jgi:hypothetical protein